MIGEFWLKLKPSLAKSSISLVILRVLKKIYVILIAIKLPGPRAKKTLLHVKLSRSSLKIEGSASLVYSLVIYSLINLLFSYMPT